MDLKKTLRKNKALDGLYDEINSWKTVTFEKSNQDSWGAHIDENGSAIVSYAPTSNYAASLAHELLHFEIQMKGYRRIRCTVSSLKDKAFAVALVGALDNELQHHRIFDEFRNMGFPNESFYCDSDLSTKTYLNGVLENQSTSLQDFILDYLTVIAPGGNFSNTDRRNYKEAFRKKLGDSSPFDLIDESIEKWKSSSQWDVEEITRTFFHLIENPTETWVGYDEGSGFPESGFFIDNEFSIKYYTEKYE